MKKVILSFDYELFFGIKSGTVIKTLIEPTNKLLDIMESCNFRGNFFVDVLMIKYLRRNTDKRSQEDLQMIEKQLCDIVKRGHRIELHLHPHWVDAVYNGDGTWNFSDYSHYSLSSFSEEEIRTMFMEGTYYINSLLSHVVDRYQVCAFRAGGWAIQPFERLISGFKAAGIKVDSSCSFGLYKVYDNSYYDFRSIPHKPIYRFFDDVSVENVNGCFIEVPITSKKFNFISWLHKKTHKTYYSSDLNKCITDGSHYRPDIKTKKLNMLSRLIGIFTRYNMLSFSYSDPYANLYYIKHSNKQYYCFIDHPKDFSNATIDGIKMLKGLCESCFYIDLVNV